MNILKRTETDLYPERVLQFGGGVFIRAFADWIIEKLNEKTAFKGSVLVVKPTKQGNYDSLEKQGGLFHVALNGIVNNELKEDVKLIKCISRIIHPYNSWNDYLKSAEQANLRFIISNTTESGIHFSEKESFEKGKCPINFPAKLTIWLFHRFKHFEAARDKGCIFLPLELMANNGQKLKEYILKYAQLWQFGNSFIEWINEHNIFCNTLVDRIVSGFPNEDIERFEEKIACKDELLVVGEFYHSWIIEGTKQVQKEFPVDRLGLNVKFVTDLTIHQQIKVRILNGAHTAMVPIGLLLQLKLVSEAITHPILKIYIADLLREEVLPTIEHPQKELIRFVESTIQRFKNTSIQHELINIALNSTSKYVYRLHSTLVDFYTANNKLPKKICFALASLIYLYRGMFGLELKDKETAKVVMQKVWIEFEGDYEKISQAILGNELIWGQDLNHLEGLSLLVRQFLREIDTEGIEIALAKTIS